MFIKIGRALQQYNTHVSFHDPWANPDVACREYGEEIKSELPRDTFDAIIRPVGHDKFEKINFNTLKNGHTVIYDTKGMLQSNIDGKL